MTGWCGRGLFFFSGLLLLFTLGGCVATQGGGDSSAKATADALAEKNRVKEIVYQYADRTGPTLIVLPGSIKSANATFTQKFTTNNIADFGEIELGRANFKVLERGDLGPLLNEISLAANMGDTAGLKKFKRGKFRSTRWFVRFDILKAEPVAKAASSFDGKALGSVIQALAGGSRGGSAAGTVFSSVGNVEEAQVWIVGLRYKVIDAATTEQVAGGYFEGKMEIGGTASSFMGISQAQSGGVTLDSMVHRLVQQAVAKIDTLKGPPPEVVMAAAEDPVATSEPTVKKEQVWYTVSSGDTLGHIAIRFKTSVKKLKEANGLKSHLILIGQKLKIPGSE